MTYDRSERIRSAAILVASLEEALAEQMLDNLPYSEATKILAEVERLGELDPEEVKDVLDEFRAAGLRGRSAEQAVEFTYSAPQVAVKRNLADAEPAMAADGRADAAATAQADADAALMADLLTHEHPQTIAAALSRLDHEQGAAVFARLPAALQGDVLERLARLEPADEDAVQELESQLQQRVQQHRQRRARAVAATELARRMLEKTAPGQRESLLARLTPPSGAGEGAAATTAHVEPSVATATREAAKMAAAFRAPAASGDSQEAAASHFEVWTDELAAGSTLPPASMRILLDDRSQELEALDDRSLLEALRLADERIVQCALAASSEKFLNRVAGKLPRRQASRLREMVRSIGPTRLTELREAQHELLRLAHEGPRLKLMAA